MTEEDIKDLAMNALHQACTHMQDALGVKYGDNAVLYFDEYLDDIHTIFEGYIKTEIAIKQKLDY